MDPCDPFATCTSCEGGCGVNCKLQTLFNCCVCTNREVRKQGHEAKKCCKRLRHEINEIEDIVEDGFSGIETLIIENTRASDACCSVTSAQINTLSISIADQISALNLSIADVLALVTLVFNCTCT